MRGVFSEYESEMLRDVMSRRPQEFGGTPSALAQWVLAQHHLLKTRFLDVTKNPLVALFFACEDDKFQHDDGRLYVIAVSPLLVKPFTSDAVSVVSNFAKLTPDEQRFLLGKGGQPPRFPNAWLHYHEAMERLCQLIQSEKPYFANRIDVRDFFKVFVVEPQQSPERIRAQSGAFLVSAFHERFERGEILNWNQKIPVYSHYELTIPCRRKTALLGDLERLNITRETLFPGLDESAKAVTSLYLSKTGIAVRSGPRFGTVVGREAPAGRNQGRPGFHDLRRNPDVIGRNRPPFGSQIRCYYRIIAGCIQAHRRQRCIGIFEE